MAKVIWEDIVSYTRRPLPGAEKVDCLRLYKHTFGYVYKRTKDYIILVSDYDVTNDGKHFGHNDFYIIPTGTIKEFTELRKKT